MTKRKSIGILLCGMFLCTVLMGLLCGCGEPVQDLTLRKISKVDPEKIQELALSYDPQKPLLKITDPDEIQEILAPVLDEPVHKLSVQPDPYAAGEGGLYLGIQYTDGSYDTWNLFERAESSQNSMFVAHKDANEPYLGWEELGKKVYYDFAASFDGNTYIDNLVKKYHLKWVSLYRTLIGDEMSEDIVEIGISLNGSQQEKITDPEKIAKIWSFLKGVEMDAVYETKTEDEMVGNVIPGKEMDGAYFLIRFANNAQSHVILSSQVKITGRISDGTLRDEWRLYPLVNFSAQDELKEILRLNPALSNIQ